MLSKTAIQKLIKVADTIDMEGLDGEVTHLDHIVAIERQRHLVEKIRKGFQAYLGSGIYWTEPGNLFKFEFCRYREPRIDYNTKNVRAVAFYLKPPANRLILYPAFDLKPTDSDYWVRGHLLEYEIKDLLRMEFEGIKPERYSEEVAEALSATI